MRDCITLHKGYENAFRACLTQGKKQGRLSPSSNSLGVDPNQAAALPQIHADESKIFDREVNEIAVRAKAPLPRKGMDVYGLAVVVEQRFHFPDAWKNPLRQRVVRFFRFRQATIAAKALTLSDSAPDLATLPRPTRVRLCLGRRNRRLHAEIGLSYARVGHERTGRALQHDAAGLQDVAAIASLERARRYAHRSR